MLEHCAEAPENILQALKIVKSSENCQNSGSKLEKKLSFIKKAKESVLDLFNQKLADSSKLV